LIVRRSFETEGGRVSYLTVDGPRASETLLLIHGAGVSARTWVNQLEGLADALRVIAINLPGRRGSDPIPQATLSSYADTAHRLLEGLETGPVFVAGHSLGGGVAQVLAASHQEVVKGLVLVSACAKLPPDDGSGRLLRLVPEPFRRVLVLWAAKKILFGPSASWPAIRLSLEEIWECRSETILWDTAAARAMDLEALACRLRVPTLILCGGRDRLTAPILSQRLSALIAASRLEIVPAAGHMLPLEAPDEVNRQIRNFIESLGRAKVPAPAARRPEPRRSLAGLVLRRIAAHFRSRRPSRARLDG
jgi:pimeloyl-ACP methyl ester carboxylesterase